MLGPLRIYFLICFQYIFVQCVIPSLNVRKIDNKVIARKRQDTLEMCRMFSEETAKLRYSNQRPPTKANRFKRELDKISNVIQQENTYPRFPSNLVQENTHRRLKRDIKPLNRTNYTSGDYQTRFTLPTPLAKDRNERADQIVEMLYANMDAKGVTHNYKGSYRYYSTESPTGKKGPAAASRSPSRRFPFAPALLAGPQSTTTPRNISDIPYDEDGSKIRFKYGIIPYFIDPKTYDSHLAQLIVSAFDYIEKATCIRLQRLRERPVDSNSLRHVLWLYISNPLGLKQCVHSNDLAEMKGVQMIVFGYNCISVGDIAHEVMHVLGFSHEHNRPDRDQYVTVLWDNIKPGYKKFFEISNRQLVEGFPYDYNSVLHYPSRAFSRNGKVTISTERGVKIGQRDGLSEIDVEKVGLVYSKECVRRNRDYLVKTCPKAVRADMTQLNVTDNEIEEYFGDRLWPLGRVYYKFKNTMEFTIEEKENILAVIRHIEKETCIKFVDLTPEPSIDDEELVEEDVSRYDKLGDVEENPFSHDIGEPSLDNEISTDDEANGEGTENNEAGNEEEEVTLPSDGGINENVTTVVNDGGKIVVIDNHEDDATVKALLTVDDVTHIDNASNDPISTAVDNAENEETLDGIKPVKQVSEEKLSRESDQNNRENILKHHGEYKRTMKTGTLKDKKKKKSAANSPLASRRHIQSTYVLARSDKPGCECPTPGKPTGNKVLTINGDCFNSVNDLLHLFGHVLGLDHQHNMHDRDSYLHINWQNLTPEVSKDLKDKTTPAASVGFPYDYQSVMHFPWLQIKDGRTNIMYPVWNDGWAMGHWQGLSFTDVKKLEKLYREQCDVRRTYPEGEAALITRPTTSTTERGRRIKQ